MRKVTKKHYWKTGDGLSASVMTFERARPGLTILGSHDFQKMNKTRKLKKEIRMLNLDSTLIILHDL